VRVLIIHNAGPLRFPSGELVIARQEAEELEKRGHDVHLHIVSNDELDTPAKAAVAAAELLWSPSSFRSMTRLIKRFRPDIVHAHTVVPLLTVSAFHAARQLRVPIVQTVHHYRWFCIEGGFYDSSNAYCEECLERGPWRGVVKRCGKGSLAASGLLTLNNLVHVRSGRLFELVDRFIAISRFVLDAHIRAGFPRAKLVLKYNGVYLDRILAKPLPPSERRGVVFAGRLVHARGVPILRGIIPLLSDIPITILGAGPYLDELRSFVRAGRHSHVELPGKVASSAVYEAMARAACALVPTLHAEGFGLAAVEAMACGTPVVASSNGSLPEILGQHAGINVKDASPASFASAVHSIVNDPSTIEQMGAAGRRRVESQFSMQSSIDELLAIYCETIGEGGRASSNDS
jgi:glycosyltransferase involved in cell wall biosynthesis